MLIWPPSRHPRNRFSLRHARASSSNSKNGRPDLGLEDVERQGVDPKAAEYHAQEICRKMIDKVRQKAAVEEKKKDDDLKKKEEVSKKLEDEKPGNLLVSVVRKVIKEEQNDSSMGSRLTTKMVSRIL